MTPAQMKATLISLSVMFGAQESSKSGAELSQLAQLFDDAGKSSLATFIKTIEANWKADVRPPRNPRHLKSVLASIQDLFAAAGASAQVKNFGTILQLFRGDEDQAVVQFLSDTRAASKKRVALRSARPGAEDIASLAQQLLELKHDREKFDALLAKCEKATVPNLKMIAAKFLGREIKGKTKKADIVTAIRQRQRQDELNADRSEAQSKLVS
jgi:hypothetical protein